MQVSVSQHVRVNVSCRSDSAKMRRKDLDPDARYRVKGPDKKSVL